jgi:xanthine dehydrogenase accessory factor
VVMHDSEHPPHARRQMAFTDAFFEGRAELEGVLAKKVRIIDDVRFMIECRRAVVAIDCEFGEVLSSLQPDVLVDARMRKHERPESLRGLAPLTVGIGPDLEAEEIADIVIESGWGETLGAVLTKGRTKPLGGEPRELAGVGRDRFVYAQRPGIFRTSREIGDEVDCGELVGAIDETPVFAPLRGSLRGLSHDQAVVAAGSKVVEIDVAAHDWDTRSIGDRPKKIAFGVLKAVQCRTWSPSGRILTSWDS